jgi:hypothetical protein
MLIFSLQLYFSKCISYSTYNSVFSKRNDFEIISSNLCGIYSYLILENSFSIYLLGGYHAFHVSFDLHVVIPKIDSLLQYSFKKILSPIHHYSPYFHFFYDMHNLNAECRYSTSRKKGFHSPPLVPNVFGPRLKGPSVPVRLKMWARGH